MKYGLACPTCASRYSRVERTGVDTTRRDEAVRRLRICEQGHRYWTREILEAVPA